MTLDIEPSGFVVPRGSQEIYSIERIPLWFRSSCGKMFGVVCLACDSLAQPYSFQRRPVPSWSATLKLIVERPKHCRCCRCKVRSLIYRCKFEHLQRLKSKNTLDLIPFLSLSGMYKRESKFMEKDLVANMIRSAL
ncbi:hypothetical protein RF11_01792 [Thelohanellus kitauei]|uniref:Uncharacterized protein n=1 Tax=Thelohanellus kitauei TaxID=669202 RepID=A0A0C2N3B9_THEKT|nr:hypothetical protein RF11_01792 [Thelohanellus kitauei]